MSKPAFSGFPVDNGLIYDNAKNEFPTRLWGVTSALHLECPTSTYFGYVHEDAILYMEGVRHVLKKGQYFSLHGNCRLKCASAIIVEKLNYVGMNMIGGTVEKWGRLKYIDGCTDSLLVPPVKKGDPCFNALFFPKGIDQTQHTHPSMRVGMVIRGKGQCVTPEGNIDLKPGMLFIIHEEGLHSFNTLQGEELVVVAYHPDSDFGPEDEEHPMINRTIVNGVSAKDIEEIRTK